MHQDKKRKEQKQKEQRDAAFDPNDFVAAMSRGALMKEEQDQERREKKGPKRGGRGGAAEGGQRGRGRGGKNVTAYPDEYKSKSGFASIYDK